MTGSDVRDIQFPAVGGKPVFCSELNRDDKVLHDH